MLATIQGAKFLLNDLANNSFPAQDITYNPTMSIVGETSNVVLNRSGGRGNFWQIKWQLSDSGTTAILYNIGIRLPLVYNINNYV